MPPLKRVQLGVQMRSTMGQIPVKWRKNANREQNDAGGDELANGLLGRGGHKPLSGKKAKDHGARAGDETQSKVSRHH